MNDGKTPALDMADAMNRLSGDKELFFELVEMILDEVLSYAQQLATAVEERDSAKASYVSHTLKGAAGNVSAMGLVDLAKQAGALGKSGDFKGLAAIAEDLLAEHSRVKKELQRLKEQK